VPLPAGAAVVAGNRITGVELAPGGKPVIHGRLKPSFPVFKLADPPRPVIDLDGSAVTAVASPIDLRQGGIAGVWGG